MRILLDANLSPSRIGDPLSVQGHDVRALAAEPELEALDDEAVLELATRESRILVTRNSRDFAPLCRIWAEAGREHTGVILIWSLSSHQFRGIGEGVAAWLDRIPDERDWVGTVVAL